VSHFVISAHREAMGPESIVPTECREKWIPGLRLRRIPA
jgi:hypothetical protein